MSRVCSGQERESFIATDSYNICYPQPCILSLSTSGQYPRYRTDSVSHHLINPLGLHFVFAPICNFPATFLYCYAVTVLEWSSELVRVLPPVSEFVSLHSHG